MYSQLNSFLRNRNFQYNFWNAVALNCAKIAPTSHPKDLQSSRSKYYVHKTTLVSIACINYYFLLFFFSLYFCFLSYMFCSESNSDVPVTFSSEFCQIWALSRFEPQGRRFTNFHYYYSEQHWKPVTTKWDFKRCPNKKMVYFRCRWMSRWLAGNWSLAGVKHWFTQRGTKRHKLASKWRKCKNIYISIISFFVC